MSCSDAATYDFEVRKGNDKTVTFRYVADGAPVNLTGATITFETTVPSLVQDAVIAEPTSGEFTITFNKEDTTSLEESRIKYEVELWPTGLAGNKNSLFVGSIKLTSEVLL